jgi:predicted esterase
MKRTVVLGLCIGLLGLRTSGAVCAGPPAYQATRRDLAAAYLNFERAMREHPPTPERRIELNREFDAITGEFFNGGLNGALRSLNEMACSLPGGGAVNATERAIRSLSVEVEPPVWTMAALDARPRVVVRSMYGLPAGAEAELDLSVELHHRATIDAVAKFPFHAVFGPEGAVEVTMPMGEGAFDYPVGPYVVMVSAPGRPPIEMGWWVTTRISMDEAKRALESRLDAVTAEGALAREAAIARSRLSLVTDHPDPARPAQFLIDPFSTLVTVDRELKSLESGTNPYRRRTGEYWRTVDLGEGRVLPMRVHAPRHVAREKPMPLVIALHGAGADENMFIHGYGAGRLCRLADRRGFLVASVGTLVFGSDAACLDRLLDDLSRDYLIDRERVYLIGHSLGAIAAAGLASSRADALAGVACIAGFRSIPSDPPPAPTLVIAAEMDRIFPADRIEEAVAASGGEGRIELRRRPNEGHTLVVGPVLDDILDWMEGKRRERAGAGVAPR